MVQKLNQRENVLSIPKYATFFNLFLAVPERFGTCTFLIKETTKAITMTKSLDILKAQQTLIKKRIQENEDLKKISVELEKINALSHRVTNWEEEFVRNFDKINTDFKFFLEDVDNDNRDRIRSTLYEAKVMRRWVTSSVQSSQTQERSNSSQTQDTASALFEFWQMSEPWQQLGLEENIFPRTIDMGNLQSSHNVEMHHIRVCLLSFSIFPVNSVLKKRLLIYWWIGEGFINGTEDKTAEEVGEAVFEQLIRQGLITPVVHVDSIPIVNKCTVHPWIHLMLILLANKAEFFKFITKGTQEASSNTEHRRVCLVSKAQNYFSAEEYLSIPKNSWTLFNLSEKYLHFNPNWLTKLKTIEVLLLGRWQDNNLHHIEVVNEELLKGLGAQKNLKYLSLRGISRITELPPSIVNLTSLEILDLKACHNLEKLPKDIALLTKLTHLDVSECSLLESMPKGIDTLNSLQVLKGFLIGSFKNPSIKFGYHGSLLTLRRLSICIGTKATIQGDSLQNISSLRCLTITWALSSSGSTEDVATQSFSFPENLHKLDLRSMPLKAPPDWLTPTKLKKLKKLYIRGGELNSFDFGRQVKWTVEILILKYLKKLKMDSAEWTKLNYYFPHLLYPKKQEHINITEDKQST